LCYSMSKDRSMNAQLRNSQIMSILKIGAEAIFLILRIGRSN
jgi:hypothetical protein